MKRILIVLIMLLICSPAAAERIAPTKDLGLYVEPKLFLQGLRQTPVYDHIQNSELYDYSFPDDLIKYIERYDLEDDSFIMTWINKYGKIHAVKISISPWYLMRDDCFEMYELVDYVLKSAGLKISDYDMGAVEAVKNYEEEYLGRNFFLTREIEDDNYTILINSIYMTVGDLTPYSLMEIFDRSCDSNYVGACIPIVKNDLDCTDIGVVNFFVTGKDKHRFDGDGNGVCCEPYPIK